MPDLFGCFVQALLILHISAPPALAVDVEKLPRKGAYGYSTIMLRGDADCGVLMHEMVHHKQFSERGVADDDTEWYLREHEAARFEHGWRGKE